MEGIKGGSWTVEIEKIGMKGQKRGWVLECRRGG